MFYKYNNDTIYRLLSKDEEILLRNCDKFCFLPMPSAEFEVKIVETQPAGGEGFRVRGIGEINQNLEDGVMSTSMSQIFKGNGNLPDTTNRDDPDGTPSPENLIPPLEFTPQLNSPLPTSSFVRKRSCDEVANSPPKRSKITSEPSMASTSTSSTIPLIVKIKPDPDSTTNNRVPSTSSGVTTIKPDPDAPEVKVKSEPIDQSLRRSCEHGIRCYRNTPDHRRDFAHPTDADYRRPNFPEPPQGTPACPWGSSCYRRNPQHFQSLSHPPSSKFH